MRPLINGSLIRVLIENPGSRKIFHGVLLELMLNYYSLG